MKILLLRGQTPVFLCVVVVFSQSYHGAIIAIETLVVIVTIVVAMATISTLLLQYISSRLYRHREKKHVNNHIISIDALDTKPLQ